MQHVMVATDGSKGANRAVDMAAELAKALAGDLLISTVADIREKRPNHFPLRLISNSKRSNFENRTE